MSAIAIDFGTSNTVVSLWEADTATPTSLRFPSLSRIFEQTVQPTNRTTPKTTPLSANQQPPTSSVAVIPSLVYVKESHLKAQILVGETVRSQRLGLINPQRFFRSFKRDLAADFRPPARTLDGQLYDAEAVAIQFLSTIWSAVKTQGIKPSLVIFSVPVGAFERYLSWFQSAAEQLDLPEVKFVDESTAAALGYAIQRPGSTVLVADFGGGTLDLSLVRTSPLANSQSVLTAEVLAKTDAYVGGEDIDRWIVEDYLQQQQIDREAIEEIGWQNLLAIAERLKIRLSHTHEAKESWLDEESFMSYELSLTRSYLETLLEDRQLLEQFRQAIDDILTLGARKGLPKSEIEQVLLVGGSCQIKAIQQLFISYFGRQRVRLHKPFEAVAHGALALTQIAGLQDYLRHGYAIRLWDPYTRAYSYFPLFEPGLKYPCKREEPITLQAALEGQAEIRLDIGEVAKITQAEVTYDHTGRMSSTPLRQQETYRPLYQSLSQSPSQSSSQSSDHTQDQVCVAHLDPPGQTGIDRIGVEFEITEHRILIATVQDLLTGNTLVEKRAIAKLN